jgi:hypothetical protein
MRGGLPTDPWPGEWGPTSSDAVTPDRTCVPGSSRSRHEETAHWHVRCCTCRLGRSSQDGVVRNCYHCAAS